jgi:release factor glutamine methyltransferase
VRLKEALASAVRKLTEKQVPSPQMNAELLLRFTLNCDRAHLYAHPERELTSGEQSRYDEALTQRVSGIPAQYITGHQEFWGLDFIVNPAVLIPRPETEHVIDTALELEKARGSTSLPTIVDVGTGSGCISVALATELPAAKIYATEISPAALEVARANAARNQVTDRITFHQSDLLAGLPDSAFDFVVSNPPYVGESEQDDVQLEVRKFEPRNAVFAGPTGLEVISRLIPQAERALKSGGWLVLEISGTVADGVTELLSSWADLRITPDLQGIARIARARKV